LREEALEESYSSYTTHVDQSYPSHSEKPIEPISAEMAEEIAEVSEGGRVKSNTLLPTIFFTLGIQLCILSLLMLLFSHKGIVMLKWDARYWFVYLLISVPFLSFGYRAIKKL